MNTEKICANCKFFRMGWFKHTENGFVIEEVDDVEDGMCLHPKIGSDTKDSWLKTNTETPPIDGIYASCDEERGHLHVGKNFGCIHFTNK